MVQQNGRKFGPRDGYLVYIWYLLLLSYQDQPEVMRYLSDKPRLVSRKWLIVEGNGGGGEIWDYGTLVTHIWGTFDESETLVHVTLFGSRSLWGHLMHLS